jgi:hypothetical protein
MLTQTHALTVRALTVTNGALKSVIKGRIIKQPAVNRTHTYRGPSVLGLASIASGSVFLYAASFFLPTSLHAFTAELVITLAAILRCFVNLFIGKEYLKKHASQKLCTMKSIHESCQ